MKPMTTAVPNIKAKYLSAPVARIANDPTSKETEVSIKRTCILLKSSLRS